MQIKKSFRWLGKSQDGMQNMTKQSDCIKNLGNNLTKGDERKMCWSKLTLEINGICKAKVKNST